MGPQITMTGIVLCLFFIGLLKIIDKAFGRPGLVGMLAILIPIFISAISIPIGLLITIWG